MRQYPVRSQTKKSLFPVFSDFSIKTCFLTQNILARTKMSACQHCCSNTWCRGLAAASACGSSWTFLFTFFQWRLEENRTDKDIQRGSYKSAHVLLNLSNELGKKIGCESLPNILSIFPAELNKFNNTGA